VPDTEVWNFGTCAYTTAQAAAQAIELMPVLAPDLVIVQLHNRGRRAYLRPDSDADLPLAAVYREPEAVLENLPLPPVVPASWRVAIIRASALARAVSAGWRLAFAEAGTMDSDSGAGDQYSEQWAGQLLEQAHAVNVPVLFVAIPAAAARLPSDVHPSLASREFLAIPSVPGDSATLEVHPPPRVLQQWAGDLARAIQERKLLERASSAPLHRQPQTQ
jgi:hypothetical protein